VDVKLTSSGAPVWVIVRGLRACLCGQASNRPCSGPDRAHGLAVITGTQDRQHTYVALTCGSDITAYVFVRSPRQGPGPSRMGMP
jgi:hypothetical protein